MTKFDNVFKSLDSLRIQAVQMESLAKSIDGEVETCPFNRAVYSHAATQSLAKSLRSGKGEGFWGAVRDQRYDEAVIESLSKSGVTEAQIGAFLSSAHGNQLGVSLCAGMAKAMGISSHVRKTFGPWSAALAPQEEAVGKGQGTVTERVAKYGTSEGARKAAETRRSYGTVGQTDAQIGAEERRYDGPKPTKEQNAALDQQEAASRADAQAAYQASGSTDAERETVRNRAMYADLKSRFPSDSMRWGKNPDEPVTKAMAGFVAARFVAKTNPYHDKHGKFTTGGSAATHSEGKGAVTETKEFKDKAGVDRVKLRSTVEGVEVSLDMRKDIMDKIRSGELATNPNLAPEKWGAGGENPKRDEFDAANGYKPASEIAEKYGKDSDAARLNGDLGKSIATAWGRIEHASNFDPSEAMHKGLLYKADQILQHAAKDIVPELEFAKAHDGNHPAPLARTGGVNPDDNFKSAAKDYPLSIDHQIDTAKGSVGVTLRYSYKPGYDATRIDPAAGPEIEHRTFVNEKGHPPFEIDTNKAGLDKELLRHIQVEHEAEYGTR